MINEALLDWYDANARQMPWRITPADSVNGVLPDPYHIWLSEVMLQQTTVAAVIRYFLAFQRRWPDVHALARAGDADVMGEWAGLGYYARARNLLKCARIISTEHGGIFPDTEAELLRLPGVGPYTAAAIAAIAFDQQATVLDANVERVVARLYAVTDPLPDSKEILRGLAGRLTPPKRPGDYAQAVMDLGATICTQKPTCEICPIATNCLARKKGIAAELPKKRPKPAKPTRYGIAYLVQRSDGAILLETRPEKGLLGGMLALPTTDWAEADATEDTPLNAKWFTLTAPVKHTFTHFHLLLTVRTACVDMAAIPTRGQFEFPTAATPNKLPTVMRKVYSAGITAIGVE
ncbi:MAG: A/G-specific adenine glycosylase [Rhodobacteraceae bacterium]|nr:A/G-specific adenine glycosylase [Paracoccaceae bacterium]